ncbi:hypothetical protein P154DRAFT_23833 [Amniculicola lignicola CBS 123094]|uniref:Uncharacterized protein n=1 Tax=Amniculicola lignicola CBS 123094 TaxID=1392246 RepID=A0A6A5WV42_9PLEO|nr:hypothetical protein P154DRAFT_23833 [Amniculicola lignicola CBS 123094]
MSGLWLGGRAGLSRHGEHAPLALRNCCPESTDSSALGHSSAAPRQSRPAVARKGPAPCSRHEIFHLLKHANSNVGEMCGIEPLCEGQGYIRGARRSPPLQLHQLHQLCRRELPNWSPVTSTTCTRSRHRQVQLPLPLGIAHIILSELLIHVWPPLAGDTPTPPSRLLLHVPPYLQECVRSKTKADVIVNGPKAK